MAEEEHYDPPAKEEWKEQPVFDQEDVFEDAEAYGETSEERPDEDDDGYEQDDDLGAGDENGPLVRYDGADWIDGIPTRSDIVAEANTNGVVEIVRQNLESVKPVFFMPTDLEELNEYSQGAPVYALKLYGVLMSGAKAEVTITGIDVFFDVRVPAKAPPSFDAHLRRVLSDAGAAGVRVESVAALPIAGYHTEPQPYKRVHTSNLQARKKAIAAVRAAGLETASDDRSSYYRKAAREYGLPLSEWAILGNYEYTPGPTDRSPLCAHVLRVPVGSYRPLIDPMAAKERREVASRTKGKTPLLLRDRTLVVTWDIETHSDRGTGDVPDAQYPGDHAFMIAMTAHWKDDPTPLKRIVIVESDAAPDSRWTTVVCGTPQNVLRAFALVYRALAPDIQPGFNDSNYDWSFIVEKARQWNILGWMMEMMTASPRRSTTTESVLKWNYNRDKKIKISADEVFFSSYLKVPGCVPQDVRVCYKKLFPKSETQKAGSLKFYLEISGLAGKADMPIKRMWRYREDSLRVAALGAEAEEGARRRAAEHMREVAHYCVVDALRCQQLLVRRNIVNDLRETGSLSFVSYFDCHYYAGGMKVCNLLGAYAWRRNILVSMIQQERTETGQYPGAHVFPPEKGLTPNPERLAALDAAALELRAALAALEVLRSKPRAERDAADAEHLAEAGGRVAAAKAVAGAPGAQVAALYDAVAAARGEEQAAPDDAARGAAERRVAEACAAVAKALADFAADYPVTGLDFASLYPSLIMAYNLSPEKILLTEEEAEYWKAQGRAIHPIEFPYNGRIVRGWALRHNNNPADTGLYPTVLIDLFNKRVEVKGVLGQHGATKELVELIYSRVQKAFVDAEVARGVAKDVAEKEAARRRPAAAEVAGAARRVLADAGAQKARTDAGLAPGAPAPRISPGSTLAEEVADLKRLNKIAKEQVEGVHRLFDLARPAPGAGEGALPAAGGEPPAAGGEPSDDAVQAAIHEEYTRACFDWTAANTKQNALKVYMNTFYGEAGNALSPFFLLQLAGGVTSAGQYNIKLVANFVKEKGFRIKYGDTDSLYLVCPAKYYVECNEDYVLGRISREEWWSALVRITMRVMNMARDEVNAFLKGDNGTPFLKMAYEEVLFPVDFDGKKKYFGIPHLNEVNFRPKKLFIKGIDVVKQGQSGLARDIGHRVMWACMALDNTRTVRKIVEDVLRDAVLNGAQWKFEHFIKSDAWKPNKNNIPVHRFIARMRARHQLEVAEANRVVARGGTPRPYLYDLPEAGERFSYVIAKAGAAFDLYGRKSAMKKGDRMEFARAAKELGLEVDVSFYMISYVVGLCARFINSDPQFQAPGGGRIPLTEKKKDELSQKAAKKALEVYVKGLSNLDGNMLRKRGFAYRRAYGRAAGAVRGALVDRVGGSAAEVLHGQWLDYGLLLLNDEAEGDADDERADEAVVDVTSKAVEALWKSAGALADEILDREGGTWDEALARAQGIEPNGSDSCPPSPRVAAKAPAPAKPPVPAAKAPSAAAKAPSAAAKAPSAAAKAPSAPARTLSAAAKAPATRLYAASGAGAGRGTAKRRPARSAAEARAASAIDRMEAAVRTRIASLIPTASEVASRYEEALTRLVYHQRLTEHDEHPEIGRPEIEAAGEKADVDTGVLVGVETVDRDTLLDLRCAWFEAVGIQLVRRQKVRFSAYLAKLRNKRLGVVTALPKADVKKVIAEAASRLRVSGDGVNLV